ncbi:hypothetical protein ACFYNZ_18935 [Streptomyces kebangsaanensis]|uniref:Uncharacterized protein n=1 Tax=Streptomyces kebangsaanensis TaxID=864058 RepID=A0ABW6KXB0_9ACTN
MGRRRDVRDHYDGLAAEYDEHWVYGPEYIPWMSSRIAEALDYRQIVTEGFRTIRTGERVRFHVSAESPDRAEFVIRLDQPDPAAYYQ